MLSIGERYGRNGSMGVGNESGMMDARFWTKFYEDLGNGNPNDEILSYESIAAFTKNYSLTVQW